MLFEQSVSQNKKHLQETVVEQTFFEQKACEIGNIDMKKVFEQMLFGQKCWRHSEDKKQFRVFVNPTRIMIFHLTKNTKWIKVSVSLSVGTLCASNSG